MNGFELQFFIPNGLRIFQFSVTLDLNIFFTYNFIIYQIINGHINNIFLINTMCQS